MATLPVIRVHHRLAQAIEDEFARLQNECHEQRIGGWHAAAAQEASELVQFDMQSAQELRPLWERLWQSFADGADCEYETVGKTLEGTVAATLQALRAAKNSCVRFRANGAPLPSERELDRVIEETEQFWSRIFKAWPKATDPYPPVDAAALDAAMEAYRRGEWQDLGELIRDLQGPNPSSGQ